MYCHTAITEVVPCKKKSGSLCYCDIVAINGHQGGPWSDPQCGRVRSTHGNGELRLVSYEREKRGPKAAAFIYFFNFGSLYRLYANGYICFFPLTCLQHFKTKTYEDDGCGSKKAGSVIKRSIPMVV